MFFRFGAFAFCFNLLNPRFGFGAAWFTGGVVQGSWGIPAAHVTNFFGFLRGTSTTREISGRGGWLETMLTWRFMDLLRTVVSILTGVFL